MAAEYEMAVEMVRFARILDNLEVSTHVISEGLDAGYARKRRVKRWPRDFWLSYGISLQL